MSSKTINRDAGDKSKGFRLQRLRAIKLLLEQMNKSNQNIAVFASTEYLDDVYIKTVTADGVIEYTEGDKNYDDSKRFSFMSKEVTNSLIIFLDNWLNCNFSDNLFYCFYTNVNYTYEIDSELLKTLNITLPQESILECLIENKIDSKVIECIKKRIIHEYKKQYRGKKGMGYLEVIKGFDDEKWKTFLSKIDWKFGQYDDKELEKSLKEILENRNFCESVDINNKEELLIKLLIEEFSSREGFSDPLAQHVTVAHVENLLLKISKDVVRKEDDPVFVLWNSLKAPTDLRGLEEKILDVDSSYRKFKIGNRARQIAAIKAEYNQLTDKEKGSYRYRIFEACQLKLEHLLEDSDEISVDVWLEEMFIESQNHINDKSKDYSYPIKSDNAIKGAILELIDSCFLSFDEKGFYDGRV